MVPESLSLRASESKPIDPAKNHRGWYSSRKRFNQSRKRSARLLVGSSLDNAAYEQRQLVDQEYGPSVTAFE